MTQFRKKNSSISEELMILMDPQTLEEKNTIYVIIRNRDKILIQEHCKTFTSTNEKGRFDILPEHANFISVINSFIILHKMDMTSSEIKINQGVMEVKNNIVYVFLDVTPLGITSVKSASQTS